MTKPTKPKNVSQISQSNELTEAAYFLSLQSKRVLWLCLLECYKQGKNLKDFGNEFTVLVSDYQETFEVGKVAASNDVKRGIEDLLGKYVKFYDPQGEYPEIYRPWLAEAGHRVARGKWTLTFNPLITPFMTGLSQQFTTFSLYDARKLNSPRIIRLYENLCQFRSSGIWLTSHAQLAERYDLPESQRLHFSEMKRTFLDPAIKKINAHTALKASYKAMDDGRLIFTIVTNES
ncbi:RepB family plasmid replication initiator protein [Salmonella enterica]|nr:RepB family plasmid replication initiator protein [Salmonella enterica]